jgi:AraC-like DNA-binding protein
LEHDFLPHFYGAFHTHNELQLTLISKGAGTAYIGDSLESFASGDIFLLGQNLPHVFRGEQNDESGVESYSIFFIPQFLGNGFMQLAEASHLTEFLNSSLRGLKFAGDQNVDLAIQIKRIFKKPKFEQLLSLAEVLHNACQSKVYTTIASFGFYIPKSYSDVQKINDVFDYLINNYNKRIRLEDVASLANMSQTAFCRYFKQHTRKTYSRFLNEIRVGQACKLLQSKSFSVSQVCYQTGFNNVSNFNRQFKHITGLSPREYIKQ